MHLHISPFYLLPERIELLPDPKGLKAGANPKGLKAGAKLIFAVLRFHGKKTGHIYPALKTLGTEIGVGENQARKYVRELEKQRLIEKDQSDRGPGFPNRYYLLDGKGNRIYGSTGDIRERCSKIPKAIMEMKSEALSHEAKIVYGRLDRFAYVHRLKDPWNDVEACTSHAELARAVGVSTWRVKQYIAELEAAGLLEVDRKNLHHDDDGRGGTYRYRVLPPPRDWREEERAKLRRRYARARRLESRGGDPHDSAIA